MEPLRRGALRFPFPRRQQNSANAAVPQRLESMPARYAHATIKVFHSSVVRRDSYRMKATPTGQVRSMNGGSRRDPVPAQFFCKVAFQTREIEVSRTSMNATLSYPSTFDICPFSDRGQRLVGQWQCGLATHTGNAQRKLRLTFASLPVQLNSNNNYEHANHLSNGNGHLPFRWIPR